MDEDSLDPRQWTDAGREEEVVDIDEGDKGDSLTLGSDFIVELLSKAATGSAQIWGERVGTYVQIAKQTEAMMFPQISGGRRPIRSRNITHTTCPRSPMTLLIELMRRASFSKPTDW
jgi:hypothetical protein